MNSLKLMQKVPNYLALLYLWSNIKNDNVFNSKDMCNFLEEYKNDNDIIKLLNRRSPGQFNSSSKTNINYITLFYNNSNIIPIECFDLLQNTKLLFDNDSFFIFFSSNKERIFFNKWIHVWSINKYIYDSPNGILKTLITTAENLGIIRENKQGNKTKTKNFHCEQNGTNSFATKEYSYKEKNGDLITLFNNKFYIDFYDIYNKEQECFYNKEDCYKNILLKINKNTIINNLLLQNISIEHPKLLEQINKYFYKV